MLNSHVINYSVIFLKQVKKIGRLIWRATKIYFSKCGTWKNESKWNQETNNSYFIIFDKKIPLNKVNEKYIYIWSQIENKKSEFKKIIKMNPKLEKNIYIVKEKKNPNLENVGN